MEDLDEDIFALINEECELKMKEIKGLKSRCITEDNDKETCPVCGQKSKHIVVWGIQY